MILSALLMGMGVFTGLIGIVADLIAVNRQLLENLLMRQTQSIGNAPADPLEVKEPKAPAA